MKRTLMFMIALMAMASCSNNSETVKVPAIDLTDFDTTVAPGEDFNQYVNGGWKVKNPLRPEYARYGSFNVLDENNEIRLNDLFASMTGIKAAKGSVEQKISDLYKQGLDSVRRNEEGAAPIIKALESLYAIQDKAELVNTVAALHNEGNGVFFGGYVEADLMSSDDQILYIGQPGLGIGDRDYYTDPANAEIKAGYKAFLEKVFALAGNADPASAAANALSVEDRIAEISWTKLQNRDMEAIYNPMSSADLAALCPGFDFNGYFQARGIAPQEKLNVEQPSYFSSFSSLYASLTLEEAKDYIAANIISDACGSLSDDFYKASFDFFSRQMSGITEEKPLWKRAMRVPSSLLGEAVGKMYVERYFPESSKTKMIKIVDDLKVALGQHIDALDWMSDETKVLAQEKLSSFTVKIGYPDKWKDYSSLEIDPELSYYENIRSASKWYIADNMAKLGKKTDRTEWGMTPQTVNAYYNPTTNEICFPAAILQPPFFNPDADDAVNYGAIGVVIGHEMTHGFDDEGRLFDKNGNMTNWWTAADDEAFRAKAEILAAQYDEVEVVPGLHADGHLSLGENIADHGGVSIAYSALQNSFGGVHPEPIDGFTAEQRFFIGFAHVWAQNARDEERIRLTKLDVHSLAENRVNVTLRNFQTFFDAFGIKEGDKMYRPESERVSIW